MYNTALLTALIFVAWNSEVTGDSIVGFPPLSAVKQSETIPPNASLCAMVVGHSDCDNASSSSAITTLYIRETRFSLRGPALKLKVTCNGSQLTSLMISYELSLGQQCPPQSRNVTIIRTKGNAGTPTGPGSCLATYDDTTHFLQNMCQSNSPICQPCVIPNMTFTSTGAIVKWIFAANLRNKKKKDYPHFELWRRAPDKNYILLNSTHSGNMPKKNGTNFYEYNLTTPWSFQEGDVLGLHLPSTNNHPTLQYTLLDANLTFMYCQSGNVSRCSLHPFVPLVTVIYNLASPTTTPSISIAPHTTTPSISITDLASPTTTPSISITVSPPSITLPSSISATNLATGLAVLFIVMVSMVTAAILILVIYKKRYAKSSNSQYAMLKESLVLQNAVYDGVTQASSSSIHAATNPVYSDNCVGSAPLLEYVTNTTDAGLYYQFEESKMDADVANSKPRTTTVVNGENFWEPSNTSKQLYEQLSQYQLNQIPRSAITVLGHLGCGEFGNVNKGTWRTPNGSMMEVALKTLREGAGEKDRVKFMREAAIMGQFHHPNVVKLYGMVTMGDPLMIVFELMEDGDLQQFLIDRSSSDPRLPHLCLGFCHQLASGMVCLSKKAFVHRDLAARNILVCNGDTCKISDFGMSRDLQDEDYYTSNGAKIPIKWTAPEALHYRTYSTASDVWSFGCVMYEIWSLGSKPFEGKSNQEVLQLIDSGYRLPPPPGCPKAIYGLMMQCWNSEKSVRPSFEAILHTLLEPEDQVLHWDREDTITHPHCSKLGAPLDYGRGLYPSLQGMYM